MKYTSTRDSSVRVNSAQAVADGISPDGGLYIPESIPKLDKEAFSHLSAMSYNDRAAEIIGMFMDDYTKKELEESIANAYNGKFGAETAPVKSLENGLNILELWHGPTCAFKDMALQLLPHLLTLAVKKTGRTGKTVILTATSGDTGKAALAGFADVPDTEIIVFYPEDGVSDIQKLQMTTQRGENVHVFAVKGNFDDTQNGVKAIFTDDSVKEALAKKNCRFSSANSINWGRLVPQIVYYISAYLDLCAGGKIEKLGEPVNIVVPTGNFGNILAAYFAKQMGLPVNKLICASNANRVLTDFLRSGVYDRSREFFCTISPSMDILISSNLERLLYLLSERDDACVRRWMNQLSESGRYEVGDEVLAKLGRDFYAGFCDDERTKKQIGKLFASEHYLCDTHTAVGISVYEDYLEETHDDTPVIIASTASPYKFASSVMSAVAPSIDTNKNSFDLIEELEQLSGTDAPAALRELRNLQQRFSQSCEKSEMPDAVLSSLE